MRTECPLLHQILKAMVVDKSTSRRTNQTADKHLQEATILLSLMGYVRSKFDNHLPTFITLALLSQGINTCQMDMLYGWRLGVSYQVAGTSLGEIAMNREPYKDIQLDKCVGGSLDNLDHASRTKFGRSTSKKTNYFTHGMTRIVFELDPPPSKQPLSRTQGLHT